MQSSDWLIVVIYPTQSRSQLQFNQCAIVDANSIDEFYDGMVGFINWFYPGTLSTRK